MKNKYEIREDIVVIFLNTRDGEIYETIIDLDDLLYVKRLDVSWHLRYSPITNSYYIQASEYLGTFNGKPKYKSYALHKYIMKTNFNKGEIVDHINHNTLDNRKENLRIVKQNNNLKNRKSKNSNNKSGYRNVCWFKKEKKWVVQLMVDGKNTILGKFDDVHEAGKFAEEMRKKHYGEFAGKS